MIDLHMKNKTVIKLGNFIKLGQMLDQPCNGELKFHHAFRSKQCTRLTTTLELLVYRYYLRQISRDFNFGEN